MNKLFLILLLLTASLSLYIRIIPLRSNNVAFTTDQGRDMLAIRDIVVGHNFTLIGPTTDIPGLFLGPFWYYFNAVPFWISGGHPISLVYWNLLWFYLAAIIFYRTFQKSHFLFTVSVLCFYFSSPLLFTTTRFAWNANPPPYLMLLFFSFLHRSLTKPSVTNLGILGLLVGINLQVEAAFGFLLIPFTLLVLIWKKAWKSLFIASGSFMITLLPQILFELKHQFLMTNAFIHQFIGGSSHLGEKLSFSDLVVSHIQSYRQILPQLTGWPTLSLNAQIILFLGLIFIGGYYFWISKKKDSFDQLFLLSISFLIFSFLIYLLYPYHMRGWYLYGITIPAFFLLSYSLQKTKIIGMGITIMLVFFALKPALIFTINESQGRSTDPSNLRNQLETIDWIYKSAEQKPFKLYTYIPSVYDYPYQYLVWWHGQKVYHYLPNKMAYLDNVPEYISNNELYVPTKQSSPEVKTYLLMDQEHPELLQGWLNHFQNLCQEHLEKLPWRTTISLRTSCPTP